MYFYSLPLASSVMDVGPFKFSFPENTNEPYSITVTFIIHPDSMADQCVVRARSDGRVTRAGK